MDLSVDRDRAGVGQNEPDQDLHQRRLAGTVLAEDAMDPPAMQSEVDAVACNDGAEPLGDSCAARQQGISDGGH